MTFRESPDYEAPTDSDRDNVYEVTVEVTDRGGNKTTRDVTVHVENEDEQGLLTVSNLYPQVGTRITPTLTDPDTPISNLIWTWEIGGNVESRASAYTPKTADINRSLEVSVTYTDGTGERQTLSVDSEASVDERPSGGNQSPRFAAAPTHLTIFENEPVGDDVGGEVTAEDPDNDDLTYSISGGDSAFSIEQDTGQIITRAELDREKRSSYRVTVTAEDPSGARDTHSLTIAVENVDEPPVITSGDVYIYYAENGRGTVAQYRAEDPEGRSIEWSLTGTDVEDFTFVRGVLRFRESPDYDEGKNTYSVTVNAGDGNTAHTDTEVITIAIINVDEKGTVELSQEPKEEEVLTATLKDPDEGVSGVTWQWARSSSRSGGFTDIQGANLASYTPNNDDTGMYLRATVTYTDAQAPGGGKSAYVISNNRTQWKASGPPNSWTRTTGDEADTTTREVNENVKSGDQRRRPGRGYGHWGQGETGKLTYELGGTDPG